MGLHWLKKVWSTVLHPTDSGALNLPFIDGRNPRRIRRVMKLANQEAQRFNHEYIGTEHLLLSIIKHGTGVPALALKKLGVEPAKVRVEVEAMIRKGPDGVPLGELPQTPRAKNVIRYSMEEARYLNHDDVGAEHILLGLLREQEGLGGIVLMNFGLTVENTRKEVIRILASRGSATST